jgi:uridine kinase
MSTESSALQHSLAARLAALTLDHPLRAGIDGVDAAGKTTFADTLAVTLAEIGRTVIRASVDGFHRPRAQRYRLGRHSPEGYYRDSFQNEAILARLLRPLGPGGSRRIVRAVFDYRTDASVVQAEEIVPLDAILLFDGVFLQRPELKPHWDATIFLAAPFAITVARAAIRDGWPTAVDDPANHRYVAGQQIYLDECRPADIASILIDNSDYAAPRVLAVRPPFA